MTLHGKHTWTRLVSTVYLILQTKMSAAADLTTNVTPGQSAPTPPDPTRVAVWVVIQGTGSRVAAENVSATFQFSCLFVWFFLFLFCERNTCILVSFITRGNTINALTDLLKSNTEQQFWFTKRFNEWI